MNLRKDHCTHKVAANPFANLNNVPILVGARGALVLLLLLVVVVVVVSSLASAKTQVVPRERLGAPPPPPRGSVSPLVTRGPLGNQPIAQCINTFNYD